MLKLEACAILYSKRIIGCNENTRQLAVMDDQIGINKAYLITGIYQTSRFFISRSICLSCFTPVRAQSVLYFTS